MENEEQKISFPIPISRPADQDKFDIELNNLESSYQRDMITPEYFFSGYGTENPNDSNLFNNSGEIDQREAADLVREENCQKNHSLEEAYCSMQQSLYYLKLGVCQTQQSLSSNKYLQDLELGRILQIGKKIKEILEILPLIFETTTPVLSNETPFKESLTQDGVKMNWRTFWNKMGIDYDLDEDDRQLVKTENLFVYLKDTLKGDPYWKNWLVKKYIPDSEFSKYNYKASEFLRSRESTQLLMQILETENLELHGYFLEAFKSNGLSLNSLKKKK